MNILGAADGTSLIVGAPRQLEVTRAEFIVLTPLSLNFLFNPGETKKLQKAFLKALRKNYATLCVNRVLKLFVN